MQIFTPTNSNNEGFILLDVIIALLILSLTLTSVYSLLTRAIQLEHKLEVVMDELLDSGDDYDKTLKKYIK